MDNDRQQAKSLIVNWPLISFLLMNQLPNDGNISKDCQTNWLLYWKVICLSDILIIDTVPKNVFIIKTKVLLPQAYVTLAEFGYSA